MTEFKDLLPRHCALSLGHNEHKVLYATVKEYLANVEAMGGEPVDFVAEGEREKAIASNELWELRWYPTTPVSFCEVYASSLEALLKWLADGNAEDA